MANNLKSKAQAVTDWLAGFDGVPPKLSAMPAAEGETGVQVIGNDYEREKFINGKARREYTIMLQYVADWSGGNDTINHKSMEYGEQWHKWVADQWEKRNLPDFGEGASINAIEPLENTPEVAAVFQSDALARYQFSAVIRYIA